MESEYFDSTAEGDVFSDPFLTMRGAIGYGLGSTDLDNNLIADAFLLGAGYIAGAVTSMFDLGEADAQEFLAKCVEMAALCLPEEAR